MDDVLKDSQEKEETQAAITLEELHGQEARRVEDPDVGGRPGGEIQELHAPKPPPPEAQKARLSRLQDTGHKGRPEDQPGAPREGHELTGCLAPRAQTDADLPPPRLGPVLDGPVMRGQE